MVKLLHRNIFLIWDRKNILTILRLLAMIGEKRLKKFNAGDHFKLAIIEKTFGKWLSTEAWK